LSRMNPVCELIPLINAYFFYKLKIHDALKLTAISWLALTILSLIPCTTFFSSLAVNEIHKIIVHNQDIINLMTKILEHNVVIDILCFVLGKPYLGYMIATTAFTARQIAGGYPWRVISSAHTLLELYAYSLSTERTIRSLLLSIIYLVLAAFIETWFIINPSG